MRDGAGRNGPAHLPPGPGEPALQPRWLWLAFAVIVLAIPIAGLVHEHSWHRDRQGADGRARPTMDLANPHPKVSATSQQPP